MQLLIIRHAIAEESLEFAQTGQPDALRPLTARGRERMARAAQGLRRILPELDQLISSPLLRTVQTADIVHNAYGQAQRQQWDELAPGILPQHLADRLAHLPADACIALVGHEPDLSGLIGWFTTGQHRAFMALKKGSVCLLECSGTPQAGRAVLRWALTSRQLRKLGDLRSA